MVKIFYLKKKDGKQNKIFEFQSLKEASRELNKEKYRVPAKYFLEGLPKKEKGAIDRLCQIKRELYVLKLFIRLLINQGYKSPIKIEVTGESEKFPDFVVTLMWKKYIIEISEITSKEDQFFFGNSYPKNKKTTIEYREEDNNIKDLTSYLLYKVKKRILSKNTNLKNYKRITSENNSILLLYNNTMTFKGEMDFLSSELGDRLSKEDIKSDFCHTLLLSGSVKCLFISSQEKFKEEFERGLI